MPGLTKIPFTEQLLPKVQNFECGDELWQREVSNWIKAASGTGGAVDALQQGTQIWLYADDNGDLVGFGSLAEATQRWPRSKDPPLAVSLLPFLAVDQRFWGQPAGPPESRYANLLLRDLVAEAMKFQTARPLLLLFVHTDNLAAIKFYERAGFVELHKPYTDRQTGWSYKRMVLVLDAPSP